MCVAALRLPLTYAHNTDSFSRRTGLLTRSAADAAIAYAAIEAASNDSTVFAAAAVKGDTAAPTSLQPATLQSVKLGVPTSFFYDDLEPQVAAAIDGVLARLKEEGSVSLHFRLSHSFLHTNLKVLVRSRAELVPIDLSEELASVVPLRVRLSRSLVCLLSAWLITKFSFK